LSIQTSATIHGSDEFSDPAKYYLKEKIESLDLLRTISEYGRGQLTRLADPAHASKVRVSRLGVDPKVYSPRLFRWNPSPFEILCVGRLVAAKGLHILMAAVERLVREGRAVQLRIAGDGPARQGLERDVAERALTRHVIFEGWQNAAGVAALYQQADIFALPSFAEGIPVVLMEAMAMEVACVATSIAGIPELIRNEVDGLLVEPANEEELAAALARLLDEPQLRLRLGKSARRRVVKCFDLSRNTAEFAAMLDEIHG
jgi:glycosyltransferase involved in cell wall biosynthesis